MEKLKKIVASYTEEHIFKNAMKSIREIVLKTFL